MIWFSRLGPNCSGSQAMASITWHKGQGCARFDHSPVATWSPSNPSFTTPLGKLSYVAISIIRRPISRAHSLLARTPYRIRVGPAVYWLYDSEVPQQTDDSGKAHAPL